MWPLGGVPGDRRKVSILNTATLSADGGLLTAGVWCQLSWRPDFFFFFLISRWGCCFLYTQALLGRYLTGLGQAGLAERVLVP